jgi:hypothetical protein
MPIQLIIAQAGPLPITASFQSIGDEPVCLEVTGTVWANQTDCMIGIAISLDDKPIGSAQIFSNKDTTHRAVAPAYIPIKLTQGVHKLTLSAKTSQTVSDSNDSYNAVIHY